MDKKYVNFYMRFHKAFQNKKSNSLLELNQSPSNRFEWYCFEKGKRKKTEMVWQWRGTNPSSNHIKYSVYIYFNGLFFCLWLLYVLWCMVLFQRTMVLKIFKENLVMATPLRWNNLKQWFKRIVYKWIFLKDMLIHL